MDYPERLSTFWREGTVELCHRFQSERLGARLAWDRGRPQCRQRCGGVSGGAEIVFKRLALLREAPFEEGVEARGIDVEFCKAGSEVKPENGGVDLGGWREGRGRKREEMFYLCVHLCGSGEQAVVAYTRRCGDPVGDLALHHDDG